MTSVSRASGQVPISTLCNQIKAFIEKGNLAVKKSEDLYLSAGCSLLELKKRVPDQWLKHAKDDIGISKTRAYELVAIAEGRTTTEETRERTNTRTKRSRAKKKSPLRSGKRKGEHPREETPEESVERRQGDKLAMRLYHFVERFKSSVLEWTDNGERQLITAVRDDLVVIIEGMAISLQDLAETIRHEPDADVDEAPATSTRRPQRPVTGEARA